MKILVIDTDGDGLAFCLRCLDAGHEVRFWEGTKSLTGEGMIDKVSDWRPSMKWADVILLTVNSKLHKELKPYFEGGYPIFGANEEGASWETDRVKGQQVLESCEIPIIPYERFSDFDSALAFVYKNKRPYACKPVGSVEDKSLSFVADSVEDTIFYLDRGKKDGLKGAFILQERVDGIEMGVAGWFGPGGWSQWIEENWEEKKFMNEGLGCNCYSADTEVLTKRGWLTFDQVTLDDEIASYQPQDSSIFFERPVKLYWLDYEGPMIRFENRYIDLLVTPSHRMWAARRKTTDWKFYAADSCPSEFEVLQAAYSKAEDWSTVRLAGVAEISDVILQADAWFQFLGLFLAEGHVDDRGRVHIAQMPGAKKDAMRQILANLPWQFNEYGRTFSVTDRHLAMSLLQFGRSIDRFVPDYIKDASRRQINLFLNAFLLGDGDLHEGRRRFHSGSYRLISDIQELLLRLGSTGVIYEDKRRQMVSPLNDKTYDCLAVYSLEEATRSKVTLRHKEVEHYSGKIGCVSLSTTHIIFVRRRGRVAVCGQTGEQGTVLRYTRDSALFRRVLEPLTQRLHDCHYVGCASVNCIIDEYGVPWPLELTMRLGWPAFDIECALHTGDPAKWMADLIAGQDTLEGLAQIAVGVCYTHGDYPVNAAPPETWAGYPLRGMTDENFPHLAFQGVMMKKAPVAMGGSIWEADTLCTADNYVLVAIGTGESVFAAQQMAYDVAWQITLPSDRMFRTDVGRRLHDELPKLQALGYALEMVY